MRVGILLVLVLGVVLEFSVLSEDEDENDDEDDPLASPALNHTPVSSDEEFQLCAELRVGPGRVMN